MGFPQSASYFSPLPNSRELLDTLGPADVRAFYQSRGVVFSRQSADGKQWVMVHSVAGEDRHPSARVNLKTGRYQDFRSGEYLSLFDFEMQYGGAIDFRDAIRRVSDFARTGTVTVLPLPPQSPRKNAHPQTDRPVFRPLKIQRAIAECQTELQHFCQARKTSDPATIITAGGRAVRYGQRLCFSFLTYTNTAKDSPALGEVVFPADGTAFDNGKRMLNVKGSRDSWLFANGKVRTRKARVLWKVEGVSDALSLAPLLAEDQAVVTNLCGCAALTRPLTIFERVEQVYVIGDCDVPGQRGAVRFVQHLRQEGKVPVKNIRLPFPVVAKHGKDLRDYLSQGGEVSV